MPVTHYAPLRGRGSRCRRRTTTNRLAVTCKKCQELMDDVDLMDVKQEAPKLRSDLINEGTLISESYITLHTSDGKKYTGMLSKVKRALINYGTSAAEREAIMSGKVPISKPGAAALVRAGALKGPPPPPPKPFDWEKEQNLRIKRRQQAEKKFNAAAAEYASNWRDFAKEMPDVPLLDAAPDAAEGFFSQYPEWKVWLAVMKDPNDPDGMSSTVMKEILTDLIYDEMVKGKSD